jgi:hypothetical protein
MSSLHWVEPSGRESSIASWQRFAGKMLQVCPYHIHAANQQELTKSSPVSNNSIGHVYRPGTPLGEPKFSSPHLLVRKQLNSLLNLRK